MYNLRRSAPVAQLDRVLGYEPRGRGFESCRARQYLQGSAGEHLLTLFFCCATGAGVVTVQSPFRGGCCRFPRSPFPRPARGDEERSDAGELSCDRVADSCPSRAAAELAVATVGGQSATVSGWGASGHRAIARRSSRGCRLGPNCGSTRRWPRDLPSFQRIPIEFVGDATSTALPIRWPAATAPSARRTRSSCWVTTGICGGSAVHVFPLDLAIHGRSSRQEASRLSDASALTQR